MHFTTRCPACGTMFRVVNDQLKLSDGWVRCGDCSHVFDATLQLQVEQVQAPESDLAPPSDTFGPEASKVAYPALEPAPAPLMDEPVAVAEAIPGMTGHEAAPQAGSSRPLSDDAPMPEPRFVRQARRRAFWHSTGVRAVLMMVSLVLSALLAVQWVLHQRDALAASEPRLLPWLTGACQVLGCELAPVRRLEAIVIDSTALVRRLDQFYGFDIVLKNTADIPLAMPALELTLTRLDDTVLARRVFLAEELPGTAGLLPASGSVAIGLRLSLADGQSMAGYRALVFYP